MSSAPEGRAVPGLGSTEQGADRCEVLTFGAGLVRTGHGTYPASNG